MVQATTVSLDRLARNKARIVESRERSRRLFQGGATAAQVASTICDATDAILVELLEEAVADLSPRDSAAVAEHTAMIAVGGSGRGESAPFSDADLLFLYEPEAADAFARCSSQVVRDCWDAGIKLGHSVRTVRDSVGMGLQEPHVATSLVESRRLWGNERLFEQFKRRFLRQVVQRRRRAFINAAIAARNEEREQFGATINQLEPDLKRSLGGLRDVHLIRWIGFAVYGTADVDLLRRHGALGKEDARLLSAAQEFLMRLRIDLHFASNRAQDVLTREEQLRVAAERNIESTAGQRSVERFMQGYFQHSKAIADIAARFVARHRPAPVLGRLVDKVMTHRSDGVFLVGPKEIDVVRRRRDDVAGSLAMVLKLYHLAAQFDALPSPQMTEYLKNAVPTLNDALDDECTRLFLQILACHGSLGRLLRHMYDVGLLGLLLPDMARARGLLQFNQYHSFTVDEHTLRAVESAERFAQLDTAVGAAYRNIRQKELLHLALLLHDLGKGREGDHSDVGREIAIETARRLRLSDRDRDVLVFLVHRHLRMSHLAFRRDISDPELLLQFSHEVGSPDVLRMLYVVTAADLSAVGPGVWTGWKADLLTELHERVALILSGKRPQFQERERLARIKQQVRDVIGSDAFQGDTRWQEWLNRQLDAFPPHYLIATERERIAADLARMYQLKPTEVATDVQVDAQTGTLDFRVLADATYAAGCFHKIAGVLTAHRLEILSAQISTSSNGLIVDGFRVLDRDFGGDVPPERVEQVAGTIRRVLAGEAAVPEVFQKHKRFGEALDRGPVSNLPMRVVVDNTSSDRCTILDVFAHDRSGLLYTIAKTIFDLDLSLLRAQIATHFDQVVDVFYVTDAAGRKIHDRERLDGIRTRLEEEITAFERDGYRTFVA